MDFVADFPVGCPLLLFLIITVSTGSDGAYKRCQKHFAGLRRHDQISELAQRTRSQQVKRNKCCVDHYFSLYYLHIVYMLYSLYMF